LRSFYPSDKRTRTSFDRNSGDGAASAQYDPWRTQKQKENDQDIDRVYQGTIERLPNPKKSNLIWADPELTPSGAATTPSAAAKQNGRNSGTPRPAKD
jgi:hypothetical protein